MYNIHKINIHKMTSQYEIYPAQPKTSWNGNNAPNPITDSHNFTTPPGNALNVSGLKVTGAHGKNSPGCNIEMIIKEAGTIIYRSNPKLVSLPNNIATTPASINVSFDTSVNLKPSTVYNILVTYTLTSYVMELGSFWASGSGSQYRFQKSLIYTPVTSSPGGWSEWITKSTGYCDDPYGDVAKIQYRIANNPAPSGGGTVIGSDGTVYTGSLTNEVEVDLDGNTIPLDNTGAPIIEERINDCPVDGGWGQPITEDWEGYPGFVKSSTRYCDDPAPAGIGAGCIGYDGLEYNDPLIGEYTEISTEPPTFIEDINNLESTIVDQNTVIDGLNNIIVDKNNTIINLESTVVDKNNTIAGLNNTILNKNSTIDGLNNTIVDQIKIIDKPSAIDESPLESTIAFQKIVIIIISLIVSILFGLVVGGGMKLKAVTTVANAATPKSISTGL